ncbi:hypothetical protein AVEN_114060-1 [Araneus ventricosus]|uniref:Uncharacterized protein n=1 Tax=Araneus ventricosus TaxID=182803 RepID=A0A4Y2MSI5_ARAVE|nr:hypothetical protein AVEN_114060-1 [Araneus ventricosus]
MSRTNPPTTKGASPSGLIIGSGQNVTVLCAYSPCAGLTNDTAPSSYGTPLGLPKSAPDSAQLTAQYNVSPSASVSEHSSADTAGYGLLQQTSTCVSLLTKRHRQLRLQWSGNIETGPWMSGRELPCRGESRFLIHHVDGRVRVRRQQGEQLPSCKHQVSTQAGGGCIMLWETFMGGSKFVKVGWYQDHESCQPSKTSVVDQLHAYICLFPQTEMESSIRQRTCSQGSGLCWSGSRSILNCLDLDFYNCLAA